jgi:acetyl-CoA carboxylase carboxyltransferase component
MGPEGAVKIVFKNEIASAQDPKTVEEQLVAQYRNELANPYEAAARGFLDDVIQPEECRSKLVAVFGMLRNKRQTLSRRKNGNLPL